MGFSKNSNNFYVTSPSYSTAKIIFRVTSTSNEGPGKTRIYWELKAEGRDSSPTQLWTDGNVYVNGSKVWDGPDKLISYKNKLLTSGNFQISHNSAGNASFSVKFENIYIYSGHQTDSHTFTYGGNYPYTHCTAPTSLSIPSVATKGKARLSWSGAGGGTANGIKNYNVWYRRSDWGGWKNKPTSDTSNYQDFTLDRGWTYYFAVQTIGKVPGYDSGWSGQVSTWVNRLPNKPSCSLVYVNNSTNSAYPKISCSDPDGDGVTIQYYSNGWHNLTGNLTSNTTYRFRGVDGHGEAGPEESFMPIRKIPIPTMSSITTSSNKTGLSNRYVTVNLHGVNVNSPASLVQYHFYCNGKWVKASTSTSVTLTITDDYVARGTNFTISAVIQDNYGNYSGHYSDNVTYSIGSEPSCFIRNRFSNSASINYQNCNVVNQEAKLYFTKDAEIKNVSISFSNSSQNFNNFNIEGNYYYINFKVPNVSSMNGTVVFDYEVGNNISKNAWIDIARQINMSNLKMSSVLKPYSDFVKGGIAQASIYNDLSSNKGFINDINQYKFYIKFGTKPRFQIIGNLEENNSNINFSFDKKQIYSNFWDTLKDNTNNSATLICSTTDVFGRFKEVTTTISLSTVESLISVTNFNIINNSKNGETKNYIFEKDKLVFTCDVDSYNTKNVSYEILYTDNENNTAVLTSDVVELEVTHSKDSSHQNTTLTKEYSFAPISKNKTYTFSIVFSSGETQKNSTNFLVKKHIQPALQISEISLPEGSLKPKVKWNFQGIDGQGIDSDLGQFKYRISYYTNIVDQGTSISPKIDTDYDSAFIFSELPKELILANKIPEACDYMMIRVEIQSYPLYRSANIKEGYSSYFLLSNSKPTYSVRKNQFGVNTNSLDSNTEAALLIGYENTKSKIIFTTKEGKIIFNLSEGSVDGAILDSGTW